jgi:hypothetical protein
LIAIRQLPDQGPGDWDERPVVAFRDQMPACFERLAGPIRSRGADEHATLCSPEARSFLPDAFRVEVCDLSARSA